MAFVKLRVSLDVHVKLHTFAILSIILSFSLDISLPFLFSLFFFSFSCPLSHSLSLHENFPLSVLWSHPRRRVRAILRLRHEVPDDQHSIHRSLRHSILWPEPNLPNLQN